MSEENDAYEHETYDTTQRRVTKEGIQYASGSSRLTTNRQIGEVSKIGKLNPVEVYATENKKVMVSLDDILIRERLRDGTFKLPEGTKYVGNKNDDGSVLQGSYARKYTLSADAPVQPGDVIEIIDPADQHFGQRAIVYRIRSTSSWTISCHFIDGKHNSTKWVFNGDQYALVKRCGALEATDYIFHGLERSKRIVREDDE